MTYTPIISNISTSAVNTNAFDLLATGDTVMVAAGIRLAASGAGSDGIHAAVEGTGVSLTSGSTVASTLGTGVSLNAASSLVIDPDAIVSGGQFGVTIAGSNNVFSNSGL